jgi:hypothetical protein
MLERDDHVGLMLPIITCDAAEQVGQLLRGQPECTGRRKSPLEAD